MFFNLKNLSFNRPFKMTAVAGRHIASGLLFGLFISAPAQATIYEIDPTHANVRFAIDHFGTSTNTGGFYNLTGQIDYDPDMQMGAVAIDIPLDTINTGNAEFDEHLKGEDFFDVEKYPTAHFASTQWYFVEDNPSWFARITENPQPVAVARVDGLLTLHGKTAPVTLTATKFNCYLSPIFKKQVCGGDFTTVIDRTQWGISKYVLTGMTKDVVLNIQIEGVKQ